MASKYSFPPFQEEIGKLVDRFGGTKMDSYKGHDISPFWDLTGGTITQSNSFLYDAPKLEKIVFSVQAYREKLMCYTLSIWPEDAHALPIFSHFWAESSKGSYFLVDFYPTADCICDADYLEHYLDPLDEAYSDAKEHFSETSNRDPSWFRSFTSPYYITADVSGSTQQTQTQILNTIAAYLKTYYALWEEDAPRDATYMARLLERKRAIRKMLYDYDPGGAMIRHAIGDKLADVFLDMLF
jgi:hypothetical protein